MSHRCASQLKRHASTELIAAMRGSAPGEWPGYRGACGKWGRVVYAMLRSFDGIEDRDEVTCLKCRQRMPVRADPNAGRGAAA